MKYKTMSIDSELHAKIRIESFKKGGTVTDFMEEVMEIYFNYKENIAKKAAIPKEEEKITELSDYKIVNPDLNILNAPFVNLNKKNKEGK